LSVSQVKQIAGRAGRYRTADQDKKAPSDLPIQTQALPISDDPNNLFPDPPPTPETENVGLVTTLNTQDLQYVRSCMDTTAEPLVSAGLFPPDDVIHRFCTYFPPGTPYSFIIIRLMDIAKINPRFQLCGHQSVIELADVLHPIKNLSLNDRISICYAPVSQRIPEIIDLIKEMATCIAEQRSGAVLELQSLYLDILDEEIVATREHLLKLETLHKGLVLYCWMSFRFPGVFIQRPLAIHAKSLVEASIDTCLGMWQSDNRFRKTPTLHFRKYQSVPNFTRDTPRHLVAY
jgi:ATP-dependent RNA helicase SUPV3L1/SUV3